MYGCSYLVFYLHFNYMRCILTIPCLNEALLNICKALADLGGRARRTPPLWDPILSFSHTFSPKSAHVGGPRPPPTGNPGSATVRYINYVLIHFKVLVFIIPLYVNTVSEAVYTFNLTSQQSLPTLCRPSVIHLEVNENRGTPNHPTY